MGYIRNKCPGWWVKKRIKIFESKRMKD